MSKNVVGQSAHLSTSHRGTASSRWRAGVPLQFKACPDSCPLAGLLQWMACPLIDCLVLK